MKNKKSKIPEERKIRHREVRHTRAKKIGIPNANVAAIPAEEIARIIQEAIEAGAAVVEECLPVVSTSSKKCQVERR